MKSYWYILLIFLYTSCLSAQITGINCRLSSGYSLSGWDDWTSNSRFSEGYAFNVSGYLGDCRFADFTLRTGFDDIRTKTDFERSRSKGYSPYDVNITFFRHRAFPLTFFIRRSKNLVEREISEDYYVSSLSKGFNWTLKPKTLPTIEIAYSEKHSLSSNPSRPFDQVARFTSIETRKSLGIWNFTLDYKRRYNKENIGNWDYHIEFYTLRSKTDFTPSTRLSTNSIIKFTKSSISTSSKLNLFHSHNKTITTNSFYSFVRDWGRNFEYITHNIGTGLGAFITDRLYSNTTISYLQGEGYDMSKVIRIGQGLGYTLPFKYFTAHPGYSTGISIEKRKNHKWSSRFSNKVSLDLNTRVRKSIVSANGYYSWERGWARKDNLKFSFSFSSGEIKFFNLIVKYGYGKSWYESSLFSWSDRTGQLNIDVVFTGLKRVQIKGGFQSVETSLRYFQNRRSLYLALTSFLVKDVIFDINFIRDLGDGEKRQVYSLEPALKYQLRSITIKSGVIIRRYHSVSSRNKNYFFIQAERPLKMMGKE